MSEELVSQEGETPEVALSLIEEEEIRLLEEDLYSFSLDAWKITQPHKLVKPNWHIEAVCDHLQAVTSGDIKNLVINIPPRHLKSNLVSVFWPAWAWIHHPSLRWLFLSYGRDLVLRDAVTTRSLIQSNWYRERWGDLFSLSSDQNVKSFFTNDKGGARLTSSFEADPTGEGGDGIIIDDPLRISEGYHQPALKHVNDVYDGTLATRLNDPLTGFRVIIMQRLNENDLTAHVLREGGWTHLYLPTEYENHRKCVVFLPKDLDESGRPLPTAQPYFWDPRTEDGQLLHPERFPRAEVDRLKKKGDLNFAGQQQQRPIPLGGGMFKERWWQYYNQPPTYDAMYGDGCLSLDAAFKDLQSSSWVVFTIWVRVDARIYLICRERGRWNFPTTIRKFVDLTQRFPWAGAKYVENKANGVAVIQTLQDKIQGIIPIESQQSKESRASAVTYLVEAGNVYLPDPILHPWVTNEFIPEFSAFPNGEYDDQVDSTTQALYNHFHLRPPMEVPLLDLLKVGLDIPMELPSRVF